MEIDVFSYSAAPKHKWFVYMDAQLEREDESGGVEVLTHPCKKVIFDMPENSVTIGIDWTPDYLKTYIDGHVIRHLENRHWHAPMHLSFTLETSPAKFGLPDTTTLGPSEELEIYYIRSWRRHPSVRKEVTPGITDEDI